MITTFNFTQKSKLIAVGLFLAVGLFSCVKKEEKDAKYYESSEYLDLTVRKRLGLVNPGERQLIVPSTDSLTEEATPTSNQPSIQANSQSNFQQWTQFLLGNNTN